MSLLDKHDFAAKLRARAEELNADVMAGGQELQANMASFTAKPPPFGSAEARAAVALMQADERMLLMVVGAAHAMTEIANLLDPPPPEAP